MSFKTLIEWLFIVWILLWKWLQACVSWIFSFIASVIFDLMRLSYTTILINYHCLNFVERHSFRRVSGKSPETMRELCLSTKFPHQEIRWNYGILQSVYVQKLFIHFPINHNHSQGIYRLGLVAGFSDERTNSI